MDLERDWNKEIDTWLNSMKSYQTFPPTRGGVHLTPSQSDIDYLHKRINNTNERIKELTEAMKLMQDAMRSLNEAVRNLAIAVKSQ